VFEVIGCDTGTRYLITFATAMNIHQLDQDGLSVAQWCFGPKGDLPRGDVLLVQKIALETMERDVLALANKQTYLPIRTCGARPYQLPDRRRDRGEPSPGWARP
jgi:hypothetical protein